MIVKLVYTVLFSFFLAGPLWGGSPSELTGVATLFSLHPSDGVMAIGTAFVSGDGELMTAAHCIADDYSIIQYVVAFHEPTWRAYVARVGGINKDSDVATLTYKPDDTLKRYVFQLSTASPTLEAGETAVAICSSPKDSLNIKYFRVLQTNYKGEGGVLLRGLATKGVSGSPVVVKRDGKPVLIGLISEAGRKGHVLVRGQAPHSRGKPPQFTPLALEPSSL